MVIGIVIAVTVVVLTMDLVVAPEGWIADPDAGRAKVEVS